jgi:hypothetical protein
MNPELKIVKVSFDTNYLVMSKAATVSATDFSRTSEVPDHCIGRERSCGRKWGCDTEKSDILQIILSAQSSA